MTEPYDIIIGPDERRKVYHDEIVWFEITERCAKEFFNRSVLTRLIDCKIPIGFGCYTQHDRRFVESRLDTFYELGYARFASRRKKQEAA
jgi:hypothetical protein